MTTEKFESEINTLKKFFEVYCNDKHQDKNIQNGDYKIPYDKEIFELNISLCEQCNSLFSNAIKHLQECPHEEKPRCRKCPNPCYNKDEWKSIAQIMKYSGIKLGLSKIKNKFKNIFS